VSVEPASFEEIAEAGGRDRDFMGLCLNSEAEWVTNKLQLSGNVTEAKSISAEMILNIIMAAFMTSPC